MNSPCQRNEMSVEQIAQALEAAGLNGVSLDDLQTAAIVNALKLCDGNRTHAAQLLGISVRTLQRKFKSNALLESHPPYLMDGEADRHPSMDGEADGHAGISKYSTQFSPSPPE